MSLILCYTGKAVTMSDSEKNENCTMETERIGSESLGQHNDMSNSGLNMNESQDFHLVDFDDDGSSGKEMSVKVMSSSLTDNIETVGSVPETIAVESKPSDSDGDAANISREENMKEAELLETVEKEKISNDNSTCQSEDKPVEEDEEIIQCTPPEDHSPAKQLVPSNTGITSLKRKAGSFDEPPKKILRTISIEDTSMPEEKEFQEEESQLFQSDNTRQDFSKNCVDTNVIIAETQDTLEDDVMETTMDKSVTDEEQAKDQDKNHLESQVKEIDKNENFNNTLKLNEAVTSREVNENTETSDTKEESAITTEKTVSDKNNTSPDGLKPTEDSNICVLVDETAQTEKAGEKENGIESTTHTSLGDKINETEDISVSRKPSNESHSNVSKSRNSIELIYDRTAVHDNKTKPKELVEIDEDGEKIVLDSSEEESDLKTDSKNALDNTKAETVYKSCYDSKSSSDFSYKSVETTKESSLDTVKTGSKLVNGSSESKKCDSDSTASLQSDTFSDMPIVLDKADNNVSMPVHNTNRQIKPIASVSKDSDHADLLSVSENESDVFIVDDKSKSTSTHSSSMTKTFQMEKEICVYVRVKCLLQVDEGTKEFLRKEITGVQCEAVAEPTLIRQKNNDTSASLADISGNDNKDASPGSINSNPQLYPLNPSRLSFASTISSLSSVSSAASLAAKLAIRDSTHFPLPRGPAKHAKKHVQDMQSLNDKQATDDAYDRLTKEWQNSHLLTTSVLNFVNSELSGIDTSNVSNERIDDQIQKIRSSTPEVPQEVVQVQTPKSSKKSKAVKRPRNKSTKSDNHSNGLNKVLTKTESVDSDSVDASMKPLSQVDDLIGNDVFAKWSDNNYYPGTVIDKVKTKYKVSFYDGKSKVLIEDFIITIPKTLREGLSVYATTKNDDYGSCGIIVDVHIVNNEVHYTVETDEGEKVKVQVKDIFLSSDQAQVLKEEVNSGNKSLPSTPKHLSQVSLDNMVDGKRRSRRIGTPVFSTPKSKLTNTPTGRNIAEPSVSGVASAVKKEMKTVSESDGLSSDSNLSIKDEISSIGVQPEIIGTPYEQFVKGPQNRIKSKSRSKKKVDDEQTIATLGPIPNKDSNLFKGMSFILTCAPLETLDRYQSDIKDSSSDPGTENEEEWSKKPFVRDRLNTQIIAGGGKVYTDFNEIPQEEYKSTKLITNVPNTTAKTLLCLSVGIPTYNHNWIIRCCQEGKIVNPAEDGLPAGWSLDKKSYVEMFERSSNKPLAEVMIIIPNIESEKLFTTFWQQICENAGAAVLLADKPDTMESSVEGTVVILTNRSSPLWVVEKANELQVPLLSTAWVVQCLIEGKLCRYDTQQRYKYNYIQN